jgi:hypothetical protein
MWIGTKSPKLLETKMLVHQYMDNCGTCSTQKSSYPDRELHTKRAITYAVLCNFSK